MNNSIPTLVRRPRLYTQKLTKVKPRRSPRINILKPIAKAITMISAVGCVSLVLYAIYLAIPHIGYGIWLMMPCLVTAAAVAFVGACCQTFLQWNERND